MKTIFQLHFVVCATGKN